MREIKEVPLHLYIGCDMLYSTHHEPQNDTYKLSVKNIHEAIEFGDRPVLRKLSDMTEEDFQDVAKYFFGTDKLVFANYDKHWYACDRELDPEFDGDIIEHINEACDDDPENTIMCDLRTWNITHGWITWDEVYHGFSVTEQAKIFQALLSKSFDLFGLIDSGLAINKTTL